MLDLVEVRRLHLVTKELDGLRIPFRRYHERAEHKVHLERILQVDLVFLEVERSIHQVRQGRDGRNLAHVEASDLDGL